MLSDVAPTDNVAGVTPSWCIYWENPLERGTMVVDVTGHPELEGANRGRMYILGAVPS